MAHPKPEVDIARNIRLIEWLKSELLDGVAKLFRALIKNSEEIILDSLAEIMISCYFLGRRLGIGFSHLDSRIVEKLKSQMETDHQLERWYGDISGLLRHYNDPSL